MSLVFFLSIFALFLFFFANFILSPERNPRFIKLMEAEHAPSQEVVNVIVGFCNAVGIVLAAVLVLAGRTRYVVRARPEPVVGHFMFDGELM